MYAGVKKPITEQVSQWHRESRCLNLNELTAQNGNGKVSLLPWRNSPMSENDHEDENNFQTSDSGLNRASLSASLCAIIVPEVWPYAHEEVPALFLSNIRRSGNQVADAADADVSLHPS